MKSLQGRIDLIERRPLPGSDSKEWGPNVDQLRELLAMKRELDQEEAKKLYFGALASWKATVPVIVKNKTAAVHGGAWAGGTWDAQGMKAEKAAADAVKVLRERAGRLLRK